jgi:pyruvate/2-oxoglutarate dehydrogenase complex dihydrolipoamide dehydrogenase (E3) component
VHLGVARFVDAHTLAIAGSPDGGDGQATVRGERIVIAAGSAPLIPPIEGRQLAITSDELLFLPDVPSSLVLVGSGAIGLEMAGAFADLGARVTVLGLGDEILAGFDADVGAYLRGILEARGVVFHRGARVTGLAGRPGDVVTHFRVPGGSREVRSTVVCMAVGRRWDPRSLGAEGLGLEMGRLGLKTSADLRTSIPHIYAAGDAAGNMQLTPAAAHEGQVAGRNAATGEAGTSDLATLPQAIFTTPEIARVGLTHRQARELGVRCHVATHDMRGASNGVATGEDAGFLKLVFESATERILGVQMVAHAAAELIQLATLALRGGITAERLASQLSIHPSQAERFIKIAAHDYHDVCEV